MRHSLLLAAVIAVFGLIAAGTAAADVTMTNGTVFIGRGDVIAYAGKDALVESPVIQWFDDERATMTCVFDDGTRVPGTFSGGAWAMWFAQPRHAPGNGTITGYTFEWARSFASIGYSSSNCESYPDSNGYKLEDWKVISHTVTLSFEGHALPVWDSAG